MWGKFLQSSKTTGTIQDTSIYLESIPDFSPSREERDNISSEVTSFSQNKKLLSILRYIRTITVLCNIRIPNLCGVNSYRAPKALELSKIWYLFRKHSGLHTQPRRVRQHQFWGDVIQSKQEIVVDIQVYSDNNSSVQRTNTLFMWGKFLQSSKSTGTIQDISIYLESIPDFSLSREERDNISSEVTSFSSELTWWLDTYPDVQYCFIVFAYYTSVSSWNALCR